MGRDEGGDVRSDGEDGGYEGGDVRSDGEDAGYDGSEAGRPSLFSNGSETFREDL
jgi:hypothetical protein